MYKRVLLLTALALFSFSGCTQKEGVSYKKYSDIDKPIVIQKEQKVAESTQVEILTKEQKAPNKEVLADKKLELDYELIYRENIVQSALEYLGKKSGGDCSGFIDMINIQNFEPYYMGSELNKFYTNSYRSKAMYNLLKSEDRLVGIDELKIGDLVFFEDTLAGVKRKVGASNITHVGLVVKIDDDATIHFIHHASGKNKIDQLNMNYQNKEVVSGKVVNSYIKRCPKKGSKTECLSSNLFSAFATPTFDTIRLTQN
ncbi:MAG: NlpC/P60 family protein [Sulfurimonadaceae bacterium]|jgi:hypothetical protein|nr:NlpC/P60 family protein [Sulfurimonadaceae bacterium]